MPEPAAAHALDGRRIRLADEIFVYVERTLATDTLFLADSPPRSYGVAPTAMLPSGDVLSAVGPGEAVWLGFEPIDRHRPALVRVRVDGPNPLDAVTGGPWSDELSEESRNYLVCPPEYRLVGVREGEGYRPFGARGHSAGSDVLERLSIRSGSELPGAVTLALVTPAHFTRLTGLVAESLDPESAYKGWRLP